MTYPELTNEHQILGSEYCSGYTDTFGNWNNGFYCPQSESIVAVFCCGTQNYKYCCMHRNPKSTPINPDIIGRNASKDVPSQFLLIGAITFCVLLFLTFVISLVYFYYSCPCKRKQRNNSRSDRVNDIYERPAMENNISTLDNLDSSGSTFLGSMHPNLYIPQNTNNGLSYYYNQNPHYYMSVPETDLSFPISRNSTSDQSVQTSLGNPPLPQYNSTVPFPSISKFLSSDINMRLYAKPESTCTEAIKYPGTLFGEDKNNSFLLYGPLVSSHENIERVPKQETSVHSTIKNPTNTNNKKVQFELNKDLKTSLGNLSTKEHQILSYSGANTANNCTSSHPIIETHRISL